MNFLFTKENQMQKFLFVLAFIILTSRFAFAYPKLIDAPIISSSTSKSQLKVDLTNVEKKFKVIVFLSAKCPCSNSHIKELNELSKKYPAFEFVGIHSNADEKLQESQKYFTQSHMEFPVVEDSKQKIAEEFKALKTPHVFILNSKLELLYQGGVTDSSDAAQAKKHFLAEVLEDLSQSKETRYAKTRALGCMISRGS